MSMPYQSIYTLMSSPSKTAFSKISPACLLLCRSQQKQVALCIWSISVIFIAMRTSLYYSRLWAICRLLLVVSLKVSSKKGVLAMNNWTVRRFGMWTGDFRGTIWKRISRCLHYSRQRFFMCPTFVVRVFLFCMRKNYWTRLKGESFPPFKSGVYAGVVQEVRTMVFVDRWFEGHMQPPRTLASVQDQTREFYLMNYIFGRYNSGSETISVEISGNGKDGGTLRINSKNR